MITPTEIQTGYVYENVEGERRIVVSISLARSSPTVLWRTANPELPNKVKAQGSSTVGSFSRWPVKMEKATQEDWGAFDFVTRRREWAKRDQRAHLQIRRAMATATTL